MAMGSCFAVASTQIRTSVVRVVAVRSSVAEWCISTARGRNRDALNAPHVCRQLSANAAHLSHKHQAAGSQGLCGVESNCWSCGACVNNTMLFCGKCEYIQPLHGEMNLFELLKVYVNSCTNKSSCQTHPQLLMQAPIFRLRNVNAGK
jgi:hypothetical protein